MVHCVKHELWITPEIIFFEKKQTPAVMLAKNTSLLRKSVLPDDALAVVVGVTGENRQLTSFKIIQCGCMGCGAVNPYLGVERKSLDGNRRNHQVHLIIGQNPHVIEIHQTPADAEFAFLLNNDDDALVVRL